MIRFREPSLSWINKNIIAGHILFSNTIFLQNCQLFNENVLFQQLFR